MTTLLRVLFCSLRKVRVFVENGYTQKGQENAIYLHGVLMAHRVMHEFAAAKFFEHPEFYPKLLMHLFETCAPKSATDSLREENRALSRKVETLEAGLSTLKRRLDWLDELANNGNGGGGGDGGDGPPGGPPGGKRKKKNRNNKNRDRDDDQAEGEAPPPPRP